VAGCGVQPTPPTEPEKADKTTTDTEFIRYKDDPGAFVGKTLRGRFRYSTNGELRDWIGNKAFFSRSTSSIATGSSVDISIIVELPPDLNYPNITRLEEADLVFEVRGVKEPVLLKSIKRP
jgi:hypothetical protein